MSSITTMMEVKRSAVDLREQMNAPDKNYNCFGCRHPLADDEIVPLALGANGDIVRSLHRRNREEALVADLRPILERFGNRGYRAAQLEAAMIGGKLYLAAYALRLGATGLTFYDDDVTAFFSPHAAGKSVMFLVALGKPARRKSF